MGSHSPLQTDDGIPLTPKEGVIIDAEGRPLTAVPESENEQRNSGFKVVSFGNLPWPLTALVLVGLAILIPLLILAACLFLAILLIRTVVRGIL